MRIHAARDLILAALLAACSGVGATGLQVAPISLQLEASENADGLWLSNTGSSDLHAQVRVYRWTQAKGEDKLVPSRDLVISPPMLQLAAGEKQLVRVIRTGAPPSGDAAVEAAYRIIIDELPIAGEDNEGVQFVLRYSVPVFIEPATASALTPQLAWSLKRDGEHAVLGIENKGNRHAKLSQLAFTASDGSTTMLSPGLLGYVLPGAHMHWTLDPSAQHVAAGGIFNARVNGETVSQPLSLPAAAR